MALSGIDMQIADYDGRTALHLATAEGHLEVVKFLLEKCKVLLKPKDRCVNGSTRSSTYISLATLQDVLTYTMLTIYYSL